MSGAAKIAPFFLASGGLAGREHHAVPNASNNQSNVAGAGDDVSSAPDIRIQPQALEDMPEHRQQLIKSIYGPESGGQYNIRYGGEGSRGKTFDPDQGHPNIPEVRADGRTSTAAGAGQFLKSTWDNVAGKDAPLSKPYMDAATWTLADRDYKSRTGRSLDEDLQKNGMTPEIKQALAPTWESLKGPQQQAALGKAQKELAPLDTGALGYIQKLPGIGALAKSEDQGGLSEQTKLALLGGLGGMLASPNRTFLGALGSGISSGVETYQGMGGLGVQQKQAETQAQLGKANIDRINFGIRTGAIRQIGGRTMAFLADGRTITYGEWKDAMDNGQYLPLQSEGGDGSKPYQPPTTQPTSGTQAAPEPTSLGESGTKSLVNDHLAYNNSTNWANDKQISDNIESEINNSAVAAKQRNNQLLYQAKLITSMPEGGLLQGGPLNGLKASVIGKFNDIVKSAGGSDGKIGGRPVTDFLIAPDELNTNIAVEKMRGAMALNATAGAGQHANRTFEDMLQYLPSNQMPRTAALHIIAGSMIGNKADMDAQQYLNDYKQAAMRAHRGAPEAYLAQNARNSFYNDVDQTQYLRDADQLGKYLHYNKSGKPVFLMDPKEIPPEFWASTGIDPKTHKYIRGN